jgi:outer membrane protein OmpA-like peptidoglycan-associated protein
LYLDSFGITEPYYIPFTADYSFLGYREWKGKEYPAVSVRYFIDERPPKVAGLLWPMRIRGASDQVVYWDPELGQTRSYTETFSVLFELSDGKVIEYRGQAEAELQKVESMEKSSLAREVAEAIEESKVADISVRVADEGVVIALENIQFSPDSAVLRPSEQEKLNRIGEILNRYPDRDILVGGHTALAGTAEGREQLSRERAAAAADYLIGNGVRTAGRVMVQGYGAEKPLAGNTTEAGRRRNRRVEITILEN